MTFDEKFNYSQITLKIIIMLMFPTSKEKTIDCAYTVLNPEIYHKAFTTFGIQLTVAVIFISISREPALDGEKIGFILDLCHADSMDPLKHFFTLWSTKPDSFLIMVHSSRI